MLYTSPFPIPSDSFFFFFFETFSLSRFLRRLEKSLKKRDQSTSIPHTRSPANSCHDDGSGSDVHDSPGVTSPLIQRSPKSSTAAAAFKSARQKRVANLYSNNLPWRLRERASSVHGDIISD